MSPFSIFRREPVEDMPAATRERWRAASTLRELGELTALWLEGEIDSQPGYMPRCGPNPETLPLVPVLARLNRSGYLTDTSQPGKGPRRGFDGRLWCQRAAVSGYAERRVADRIAVAAERAGMLVLAAPARRRQRLRERIPVTTRAGHTYTAFGASDDLAFQYGDCSDAAIETIRASVQVTVVDPEWGRQDVLWKLLSGVAANIA